MATKKRVPGKRKASPSKKTSQNRALTLPQIEKLLGEDFESLAQARAALKRETKSTNTKGARKSPEQPRAAKSRPPVSTKKRIYNMRSLPEAKLAETFNATLEELYENSASYDALLKDGEGFGGRIGEKSEGSGVGYTFEFFPTFRKFLDKISEYDFAVKYGDNPAAKNDLLNLVKIIRYREPGPKPTFEKSRIAWKQRKQDEVGRQIARREAFRQQRKQEKQAAEVNFKLLRQAQKREDALELEVKILRERLARKEAKEKATKKTKKKSGKK